MALQFPLLPDSSLQSWILQGGAVGFHTVYLAFDSAPSAGTVTITYREIGSKVFRPLAKATAAPVTSGELAVRVDHSIAEIRAQFAGLVGGTGPRLWLHSQQVQQDAFNGLSAMTVQPYTEANVKSGLQFFLRASWPLSDVIAQGTSRKLWFKTGSKQVIVKIRDFQYVSEELAINLYSGPTGVAGGTDIPIRNYNNVAPVASTVIAKNGVTTVSNGTLFDGPEYFYGSANSSRRQSASIPLGRERIIPANSEFIVEVTASAGIGNSRAQYFLDWYEGGTDLPL